MSTPAIETLFLRLSGQAPAVDSAGEVTPLAPRDAVLLAWLALEGPTPRVQIAEMLWPDSRPAAARNTLRQRLFKLKKLYPELLHGEARLALGAGIRHDLDAQAGLLGGLSLPDCPRVDEWMARQRALRMATRLAALTAEAQALEIAGKPAAALCVAERLLASEPLSEAAHRRVMRLHYLCGDRAAALLAFDRCERVLKDEVCTRPSAETLALLTTIEQAAMVAPVHVRTPLPASVLRPPRLIGRERQREAMLQAWDNGQVAMVIGEAGMGKTRLLHAFAQGGDEPVVVSARPGDAGVPFATLARVLREVLQRAPAALLEVPRQEIARLLPELGEADSRLGEAQRAVLEHAVGTLLRAARAHLDGVVVDDLQFADVASIEMLRVAIIDEADASSHLRWALAMRPAEAGSAVQTLMDVLLDQGRLTPISLPPLDANELVELLRSLDLPELDPRVLAPQLLQHTGGNPMFVLETLKHLWLQMSEGNGSSLPRPANVGMLIERRLAQLSAPALTLARVAAISGIDFCIPLAEAVIGQPALQLASAWQELEAAQVLRDGAFAHDLVYEAALRSVPPGIARHTHAVVAEWLGAHGGEPARVAEHWTLAGDAPRAVPHLMAAAKRSSEHARLGEAREFLERAVAACGACKARETEFEALLALHQNYVLDDPGDAHERVVARLRELAESDVERLRAAVAGHDLRRRRSMPIDLDAVARDLALAERIGDRDHLRQLITMQVAGMVTAGRPDASRATLDRHQALFDAHADAKELADFHGNMAVAFANLDQYPQAFEHAQRAIELYRKGGMVEEVFVVMSNQVRVLRMQGRVARANELLQQLDRWHASESPNPRAWLVLRAGAGEVLRDVGLLNEALQALQVEPDKTRRHVGGQWLAWPVAMISVWLALGQHARAQQVAAGIDDDAFAQAPDWLQARCKLAQAQVGARVQGQGEMDRPGARELAMLEEALALAPRERRRSVWIECELQLAAWADPAGGAQRAKSLAELAARHDMRGYALAAMLCELRCRLDLAQHEAARALAGRVREALRQRFTDACDPEEVFPITWSRVQRDLVLARALEIDDPHAAADSYRRAARAVTEQAERLPVEFRSAFMRQHPVHRQLRA